MMRFIKKANLPEGDVTTVICGELPNELKSFLASRGIEMLTIKANEKIDPAVKFHSDMAAIYLGGGEIIVDSFQKELTDKLKEKGFSVARSHKEIAGEYPGDVALNFTVIGDKLIGSIKNADETLTGKTENLKKINVKQGYCKCSCLVINEKALITDDKSIYDNASKFGIDCLLISKGDILLSGHEYGFIGGASAKISKDEILFFGDVTRHRDYKKIADFIEKHGCKIISLNFMLTDLGGIIALTEKTP